MTIDDVLALHDKWQRARQALEDSDTLLDVENSKADEFHYELLYRARVEAFREFELALKQLDQVQTQHVKKILAERKVEREGKAHPQAR